MHLLMLLAALIIAPTFARADNMSLIGGSGCSDPPIFNEVFTFSSNSTGGECLAFGNYTGGTMGSLSITTKIPDANTDANTCSGGNFFLHCTFTIDTVNDTLTVDFFGTNSDSRGIPEAPGCSSFTTDCTLPNNFSINLNNLVCDPTTGLCSPPSSDDGTGDWLSGGKPESFTATATPEPQYVVPLLAAFGALIVRQRFVRRRRG